MKSARFIYPAAAALVLIAAVVVHTTQRQRSRHVVSAPPLELSVKSTGPAQTTATQAASAAKPVDLFFLSEGVQQHSTKANPPAMKQPVANGTRRVMAGKAVTKKADGPFIAPRWSPDGLQLMFSKPGYNGVYTMGVDGGLINQVTDREGAGFKAKWGDDGNIETHANTGETQAFKSDGTPVDAAAYENDSSLVGAFTKDDTVYLRKAPGEAPQAITDGDDRYYGGVLSPDGKYIAYNGLSTGLYIKPVDGSGPPVSLGEGYSPSWLPDGSGVVYNISQDDGHNITGSDLFLATPDGSTISNLTQTDDVAELNPTPSPDGTHITYEIDGVIYVAELR